MSGLPTLPLSRQASQISHFFIVSFEEYQLNSDNFAIVTFIQNLDPYSNITLSYYSNTFCNLIGVITN